jgi:hypothetical protein
VRGPLGAIRHVQVASSQRTGNRRCNQFLTRRPTERLAHMSPPLLKLKRRTARFGSSAIVGSCVASEWRRGGSEDPWLCAPGFRRVCTCRRHVSYTALQIGRQSDANASDAPNVRILMIWLGERHSNRSLEPHHSTTPLPDNDPLLTAGKNGREALAPPASGLYPSAVPTCSPHLPMRHVHHWSRV